MFELYSILGLIGARGGSKGLKNKNTLDLAGKPLIVWTIEAALESLYIDRTVVSTDSEPIVRVSRAAGADVPFLRPAELAQDDSTLQDVCRHAVEWLRRMEQKTYDFVMVLQPTSPMRTTRHIDEAVEWYFKNRQNANDQMASVYKAHPKTGWLMEKGREGYVSFCIDRPVEQHRRQNIPQYYLPNGAIFMIPVEALMQHGIYATPTIPFVMSEEDSADIDTLEDLQKAQSILDRKEPACPLTS